MIKSSKTKPPAAEKPHKAAILLASTIADTTWRMFLPTLGGMALGMWIDKSLNTKVIFTVILIAIGFCLGIALVLRQLKRIDNVK